MNIVTSEDSILHQKSVAYTPEEIKSIETQRFIDELFNTMFNSDGIGISAVQVGVLKRVICVNTPNFSEVMFNPVILKRLNPITGTEGCLSFPGILKDIKRSSKIHVKWIDRRGKSKYSEVTGLAARAIQHECDHLNGKTFDTYGETL